MQDFRQIAAWRKAHALALNVRRAVERMPRRGYASLKSQMIAAAESIAYNIVEGSAASTRKEFARFLDISIKSTSELDYQLQLAHDYGVVPTYTWKDLSRDAVEVRKMTCGLRGAVLRADRTSQSDD